MTGKQHFQFGVITGASAAFVLATKGMITPLEAIGFLGLSAFGSNLPDIDTPESKIGQRFQFTSLVLCQAIGHRTYTHSILLWTILGILCHYFCPIWVFGLIFGVVGHLFLDSLTIKGIPISCSFKKNKLLSKYIHILPSFLRCRGGSFWSYTLLISCEIITVYFAYKYSLNTITYPIFFVVRGF